MWGLGSFIGSQIGGSLAPSQEAALAKSVARSLALTQEWVSHGGLVRLLDLAKFPLIAISAAMFGDCNSDLSDSGPEHRPSSRGKYLPIIIPQAH